MKLLVVSSILILSRTAGVAFGSNIRSSGAIGTADEEEQPQSRQTNRNLQVSVRVIFWWYHAFRTALTSFLFPAESVRWQREEWRRI